MDVSSQRVATVPAVVRAVAILLIWGHAVCAAAPDGGKMAVIPWQTFIRLPAFVLSEAARLMAVGRMVSAAASCDGWCVMHKTLDRLFGKAEEINGAHRCPTYLYRWIIVSFKHVKIYLHKFVGNDWSRDRHDHPKRFISIGLWGSYLEESENAAQYIDGLREDMEPLYEFFTPIVQRRAWSEEFYATVRAEFPEKYGKMPYNQAFYQWSNSFTAEWPSLLIEPESEQAKAEDVRLKAILALVEILMPALDPENKAAVIEWCCDNFNALKLLFSSPLVLDFDQLIDYAAEQADSAAAASAALGEAGPKEPAEPEPFSAKDAVERPGMARYNEAIAKLIEHKAVRDKRKRLQSRASVPNLIEPAVAAE